MQARLLMIEEKRRKVLPGLVGPADFKVRDGGAIEPRILLQNPNLSLYCLDFDNRQALFVETSPECRLSQAPFLYQAQYEAARHLIQIPYDMLHSLAAEVRLDPAKLILIYSVGRCGSTLVSRAFNQVEGVESLSEPDVFTQMRWACSWEGPESSENAALLKSCTLLQCVPGRLQGAGAWALKFRSEVTILGPKFYSIFPEAKVVFLYRNAVAWMRSYWRYIQTCFPKAPTSGLRTPNKEGHTPLEKLAGAWLGTMQACREMQRQGIPMFLARYEDLTVAPWEVLSQMFAFCGLAERRVGNLDVVLKEDAQEGTALSRTSLAAAPIPFTEEDERELRRLLQECAGDWSADIVLPGTYLPAGCGS